MSSEYKDGRFPASKCTDGDVSTWSICHSDDDSSDTHPWVALQFGGRAEFTKVVIDNREDCCGERMENMRIFACDALPSSGSQFVTGCQEFAEFAGPGETGKTYKFQGAASGRVLVVQMETNILNIREIKVFGRINEGEA